MKEKAGRITRLWLTMIHVSDMDKALEFYHGTLGLPIALVAKMFNHAEVGPEEPLAKIGLHAVGRSLSGRGELESFSIQMISMPSTNGLENRA